VLRRNPRLTGWALGATAVAALTLLQMVRRPSAPPVWDSLIAEDGSIFLSQALGVDFLNTLANSYQGYLHTAPRLITFVATWFPLDQAALVISLLTALVIALVAVYVFRASAAWIASPLLRGVLALAVPFIPLTARQMAGTVSNLHWYLLYGAFWAVICPWRSRRWLAASTAVVALAVLSDPQVVIFLPIALVVAVRASDRRTWILPATIAGGVLLQVALRDEGTATLGGSNYGALPRFFAERVTSSLFVGDRYLKDVLGGTTGSPVAWASLAVVAAALGVGLWRLRGPRRWLLAGCAGLSVVFFLVAPLTRGTRIWPLKEPWVLTGTRYLYLPVLFLLTGLFVALDRGERAGWRPRVPELAIAALAIASMAVGYAAPHRSSGDLRWKPVLARARLACAEARPVRPIKLYGAPPRLGVFIPIDPQPRWWLQVGCSHLD
jgi:hypothetical protein